RPATARPHRATTCRRSTTSGCRDTRSSRAARRGATRTASGRSRARQSTSPAGRSPCRSGCSTPRSDTSAPGTPSCSCPTSPPVGPPGCGCVRSACPAAVGAGLLVKTTTIDHSHLAGGRSLHAVSQYSAHWSDLVRRTKGRDAERFVFLGWATPVLAAIGLGLLARARRGLAVVLGLGA